MSAPQPEPRGRVGLYDLGAAGVSYALLAAVATWPLLLHFRDRVPGGTNWRSLTIEPDSLINVWNLWWFRFALLDLHQSPFDGSFILHPFGANLWFHTLAPLHAAFGLLLQTFVSLTAAQNLLLFLALIAAGLCAFALARRLGLGRGGALVAGAIYAFSPAVFGHLYGGHFELIATFWLPALLAAFLRLLDAPTPGPRDAILLASLLAGSAYSSQYYSVYGVELLFVAACVRARDVLRPAALRALALAAALVAVGWTPLLVSYLGSSAPPLDAAGDVFRDFDFHAGDALGFVVPAFTHPLLAEPLGSLHERLNPPGCIPHETTTYVGWVVLALAVAGGFALRRAGELRLPLAIALVFSVLSLGSHLRLAGVETGVPLPAHLFEQVPLLRLARAPGRHIVVAMLGFGLLAGAGWQRLRPVWLRAATLALLALEFAAFPIPTVSTEVSPLYRRLAEIPGDFAVLELPPSVRDGHVVYGVRDNRQIFAQSVHQHRVVGGAVSRLPAETWQALFDAPVIGTLLRPNQADSASLARDRDEGPAFLARHRIDAVVLQGTARGTAWEHYADAVLPIEARETFSDGAQLLWLKRP